MVLKKINISKSSTIGQVFTPDYIAEFMVKNVVKFIENYRKNIQELNVLEPSAGKGIFLKSLLQNDFSNIIAYEMDIALNPILSKSFSSVEFRFDNFLGSDINEKFDIIIGNPPYLGQNYNAEIFQDYFKKYPICAKYFVGNMDLFYFFIHLGIEKLNPGGILSFITTNYWITKSQKTGIKYLKPHIIDECFLIQYIDLFQLKIFEGEKGQNNCIFVLKKKKEQNNIRKKNMNIEIIRVNCKKKSNRKNELYNQLIFEKLTNNIDSSEINRFTSVLTNRDLIQDESWNLIYPKEVKAIVGKIENYCKINGKISFLKDYFLIRNGLILIKDSIFILRKGINLKVKNGDYFIYINGEFIKLPEIEKTRLKKLYKSKSIKPYEYDKEDYTGYAIYFNKNEFKTQSLSKRNNLLEMKYPILSKYLKQHEKELREILINAKENPENFYFPRRGSFINKLEENYKEELLDLEPLYELSEKIFFKFISKENIFSYSNTSYYATSDTYFLWPRFSNKKIDYLFILAYLNSKILNFLFKVKNISIKRSKTKLEHSLPIPILKSFHSENEKLIIRVIKALTFCLIKFNELDDGIITEDLREKLTQVKDNLRKLNKKLISKFYLALEKKDRNFIVILINKLFFQLFSIDEDQIEFLIKKFY